MNKTALLLLLCVPLSACKFHHLVSRSRPELQWQDKTHCIEDSGSVWQWQQTPENEQALNAWWNATSSLGTEEFWPKSYSGIRFILHPRLQVRLSERFTVFHYNRPGYDAFITCYRRATEADRLFRLHLENIMGTQSPLSHESGQALQTRICPPIPRNSETAWMP